MQGVLSAVLLAAWSWGDKSDIQIPMALFYALLGILVVFAVLFVLILLFTLLEKIFKYNLIDRAIAAVKRFFGKLFKRKSAPVESQPVSVQDEEDDEEVVAAITAAIAVLMQDEGGAPAPFKIRSIKRNHCH